jgi:uncharacterized protein YdcH (DUF465 family)
MESSELELIHRLSAKNDELRHLFSQHQKYESQLTSMTVRHPSESESREIARVKRLKLRGKDRIQQILAAHR